MSVHWWPEPDAGDVAWCHFSSTSEPGTKPRPCLVLEVDGAAAPQYQMLVAYGTSQRTTQLLSGEFAIILSRNQAAYALAGLSHDTKFNMKLTAWLPYNSDWFKVPPGAPQGQMPQLGTLHPSLMPALEAAYLAAHTGR